MIWISVHPVLIILIAELAEDNKFAVGTGQDDGGMGHTVEHRCLHRSVVEHVLEDDVLPHLQLMVESPALHEVAAQAGVASKPIDVWFVAAAALVDDTRSTHARMIGHLQAVGHVAGKADVEDGSLDSVVLHDVLHLAHQRPRLPAKGTAWLQYHVKPRIALVELLQRGHQTVDVIVAAGHQMAATEVDPFQLRKPPSELILDMGQRTLKGIASTLAVAMDMEARDVGRQLLGQTRRQDSEARAWRTRIVEQGLNLTVFRVDSQPHQQLAVGP